MKARYQEPDASIDHIKFFGDTMFGEVGERCSPVGPDAKVIRSAGEMAHERDVSAGSCTTRSPLRISFPKPAAGAAIFVTSCQESCPAKCGASSHVASTVQLLRCFFTKEIVTTMSSQKRSLFFVPIFFCTFFSQKTSKR